MRRHAYANRAIQAGRRALSGLFPSPNVTLAVGHLPADLRSSPGWTCWSGCDMWQMSVSARYGYGAAPGGHTEPALTDLGRNSRPARHQNDRSSGSSGGKRRPEPHGHKSFRPSFSTSSVSRPTVRVPRLTRDSLGGTPGGAYWSAQKEAPASWSMSMIVLPRSERKDRNRYSAAAASRFRRDRLLITTRSQRQMRMLGKQGCMANCGAGADRCRAMTRMG